MKKPAVNLVGVFALLCFVLLPIPAARAVEPQTPRLPEAATYYIAFLRKGPQWSREATPESQRIQAEHMANIRGLFEAGSLVCAGPFADDGDLRGIFILKVDTIERAKSLAESDPAVKAGRLSVQVRAWHGTKGIGEKYAEEKRNHPEAADQMASYQLVLSTKGPRFTDIGAVQNSPAFPQHLAYIAQTMASGKLRVGGPFSDSGEPGGVFIFDAGSPDQARALAENDPLVKAGFLVVQVHPWMTAKGVLP